MIKLLTTLMLLALSIQLVNAQEKKMKPEETEDWSRKPEQIHFAKKTNVPDDAIVLFSKGNLDAWKGKDGPAEWTVKGNKFVVEPGTGAITTKESFGSCQLHVEWKVAKEDIKAGKTGQGCSNSGVFLMGRYEVQVLNSYENETYYNGQATSIYKQHIPLVNAMKPTNEWQVYDIIFTAPVWDGEGDDAKLVSPAYVTVIHNGVLVQNHVELKGPTEYIGHPEYKWHEDKLPISLQDHSNKVSFRNIWIRNL